MRGLGPGRVWRGLVKQATTRLGSAQISVPLVNPVHRVHNIRCYATGTSEQQKNRRAVDSDFLKVFSELETKLSFKSLPEDLRPLLSQHISKCLQYNVPNGKKNRGYSVPASYKLLAEASNITPENIKLANILGWTVEFLQAFFLVADDIMDGSQQRRGHTCWYKVDDIGLTAFNDSVLLEAFVYSIIKEYFRDQPYYLELLELMRETTKLTAMGQALDLLSADTYMRKKGKVDSLEHFTEERYKAIVKYKTAYYSFYLPVALAMRMAGITDENLYKRAELILLKMGDFFQVQDDYLDCFGDPEVTGKLGTDIQDGKCSWLVSMALKRSDHDKKAELALRYGSTDVDDVEWVKELYSELDLQGLYLKYQEESYEEIKQMIQQIPADLLPKQVFYSFLDRIYKRNK